MVVSTSLWLHLHCKRAFVPPLGLLQRQFLVSRRNHTGVAAVSIGDVDRCVSCSCEACVASKTKAAHMAIGELDLICLIVFVPAVSVAKAGRAVHSC